MDPFTIMNLLTMGVGLASNLGGSVLSYVGSSKQASKNRAFQARQAQLQRDWLTEMSNTAHQREVADLRAAGLNPILSANSSGASVPSAGGLPSGSVADVPDFSQGVNSAISAARLVSDVHQSTSQSDANTALAAKYRSETAENVATLDARGAKAHFEAERTLEEIKEVKARTSNLDKSSNHYNSQVAKLNTEEKLLREKLHTERNLAKKISEESFKLRQDQKLSERQYEWMNRLNSAQEAKDWATAGGKLFESVVPINNKKRRYK